MKAQKEKVLLTLGEAADELGVGRRRMRRLIDDGVIQGLPVSGRQYMIPRAHIEKIRS